MIDAWPIILPLSDCRDVALVGGKGASLGALCRAGFLVPDGFVLTTAAYRLATSRASSPSPCTQGEGRGEGSDAPLDLPLEVVQEIRRAYVQIGGGLVAVRSSATAEDAAGASMAGQCETFLDIEGDEALLRAIANCWSSLKSPRIVAYLSEHKIDISAVAMAVVVQRMIPSRAAGVLFTVNPNGSPGEMLIEASWGLGETVVSGDVQPDELRVDRQTGRVLSAIIADKKIERVAGHEQATAVDDQRRRRPCLSARDADTLWRLGRQVEEHFGSPRDIEWAIAGDQLYLLQSRPITTWPEMQAACELTAATIARLRSERSAGRGPWVLHNLGETIAHPTPLTWSVVGRFMTGSGGYGAMYRVAGFEPSPAADRDGFLELIAGRIYMDASRAPEMLFADFPFAYDAGQLKSNPGAGEAPPTIPVGSARARWAAGRKLRQVEANLVKLSADFDKRLRNEVFPAIAQYAESSRAMDLSRLSNRELIDLWTGREKRVMDELAPQTLLPSLIAGMAMSHLRDFLAENFWHDDPEALSQLLSSGGPPNETLMADAELFEAGRDNASLDAWLAKHGHRAAGEFDLASPRWRERPGDVRELAGRMSEGAGPMQRHQLHAQAVDDRMRSMRLALPAALRTRFDEHVELSRRCIAFREDGKNYLMLGYQLLRDVALEAGRKLAIGEDIFFLTREELLDVLRTGYAPLALIEQRKRQRRAEEKLQLPRFIDDAAIAGLGEPAAAHLANGSGGTAGLAISAGIASGPVLVRHSPTEGGPAARGYVLVCPSTDPSWTPLFVNAAALVLERGGSLSHGAVVAREMGLPAVVVPEATRTFHDGEIVRVDGDHGRVERAADVAATENAATKPVDPADTHVEPRLIPPPPGCKDRTAARWRNVFAAAWGIYLLAYFLMPQADVAEPSLHAMDLVIWPVVRWMGKPAAVAIVACVLGVAMLLCEKWLTDSARLVEVKKRAAELNRQANKLPAGSARRAILARLAGGVPMRLMAASMVPVGILLGPVVLSVMWFKARVDPAAASPPAGASVRIVATVASDFERPVKIDTPSPLVLDDTTPLAITPPPVRQTLENLLVLYRQQQPDPQAPWQLQLAPDLSRQATVNDLQAYLDRGVPAQELTWVIHSPPGTSGRYVVNVTPAGHEPTSATIVLGEKVAPAALVVNGTAPITKVRVIPPMKPGYAAFWTPLRFVGGWKWLPMSSRLAEMDVGWVWVYVVAYVMVLVGGRKVLRLA
jgi:pyruvate,water dikinase